MQDWLDDAHSPTQIFFVSGMGGVGKSTLMLKWLDMAEEQKLLCLWLDARTCAPTPAGFIDAIGSCLLYQSNLTYGTKLSMPDIVNYLSTQRTVLCIDNYDHIQPVDAWLRDIFLPELSATDLLLVFASRQDLSLDWKNDLAWRSRVTQIPVATMSRIEARQYYINRGIRDSDKVDLLIRQTKGLPLATSTICRNCPSRSISLRRSRFIRRTLHPNSSVS